MDLMVFMVVTLVSGVFVLSSLDPDSVWKSYSSRSDVSLLSKDKSPPSIGASGQLIRLNSLPISSLLAIPLIMILARPFLLRLHPPRLLQ